MKKFFFLFFLFPVIGYTQVVKEVVQLDTITETIDVIYQPTYIHPTTHYSKKIGLYASDTSQVAIEKTYLRDRLNGVYKVFYPSGKPKVKAVYANGKSNGEFTWYNENGIIRVKGMYKDSIKNGFWAYKYLKIYGRYKDGKKHKRWYKVDPNKQKIKSWYKHGVLVKGKGFEFSDPEPSLQKDSVVNIVEEPVVNAVVDETESTKVEPIPFAKEYEQVVYYLRTNFVLKRTLKAYFGAATKDLWKFKKNYKSEVFQFLMCESIMPLDIDHFVEKSKNGIMEVAKMDSVLKVSPDLKQQFADKPIRVNNRLSEYKSQVTKEEPLITVYFSEVIDHFMRVDIIWNKDQKEFNSKEEQHQQIEKDKKFSILLYFNNKKELAGAEYQAD